MSRIVRYLIWLAINKGGDFLTTVAGEILTDANDLRIEYTRGE